MPGDNRKSFATAEASTIPGLGMFGKLLLKLTCDSRVQSIFQTGWVGGYLHYVMLSQKTYRG